MEKQRTREIKKHEGAIAGTMHGESKAQNGTIVFWGARRARPAKDQPSAQANTKIPKGESQ